MVFRRVSIGTCLYIAGMVIVGLQPVLGIFSPSFQGLLPYGGSEEAMYMIRTQESLKHPYADASNGVWMEYITPRGTQAPGLEEAIGTLFFWTGLSAPWIVFFLTLLIAPLVLPLTVALSKVAGAKGYWPYVVAFFYFWLLVFCRRYFHPAFSLPVVMGELLLLWKWFEFPTSPRAFFLGVLLGFSIGVYLWAWTFLFTVTGLLFLVLLFDRTIPYKSQHRRTIIFFFFGFILTGISPLMRLVDLQRDPLFEATAVRAGLVATHLPESLIRSALFVLIAIVACVAFARHQLRHAFYPLLASAVAIAIMYNQQLIHGRVISFSSHYIHYAYLVCVLLIVAVVAQPKKTIAGVILCILCMAPLATAVTDHTGRLGAFIPPDSSAMAYQHLRPVLDFLNTQSRQTVLTDRKSADIVASYTDQNVVFTEYTGFLLISDEDYAQRACMSELFSAHPPAYEHLVVHAEERLRVIRGQERDAKYQRSLQRAYDICEALKADPLAALQHYSVTLVLWDQATQPNWNMNQPYLKLRSEGEGWKLYDVDLHYHPEEN